MCFVLVRAPTFHCLDSLQVMQYGSEKERGGETEHLKTCMCVLVCLHTLIVICKSDSGERWGVSSCFLCECVFKRLRQGKVEHYFTQTKR